MVFVAASDGAQYLGHGPFDVDHQRRMRHDGRIDPRRQGEARIQRDELNRRVGQLDPTASSTRQASKSMRPAALAAQYGPAPDLMKHR